MTILGAVIRAISDTIEAAGNLMVMLAVAGLAVAVVVSGYAYAGLFGAAIAVVALVVLWSAIDGAA